MASRCRRSSTEAFDLTIATASGERTKGEKPGIRRRSCGATGARPARRGSTAIEARPVPDGQPLPVAGDRRVRAGASAPARARRPSASASSCRPACARRRSRGWRRSASTTPASALRHGIDRFVALAHTEGCGFGGEIDLRHAAADLPRLRHASQRRGGAAARARLREGAERRDAARLRARRPAARSLRLGERPARWRHRSRDRARPAVVRHAAGVPGRRARRPARRADDRRPQRRSARGRVASSLAALVNAALAEAAPC